MPSNKSDNQWNRSEVGRNWRSKYRKANRSSINTYQREYYAKNKDRYKNTNLKALYGITLEDKKSMYVKQNGRCAICRHEFPERKLFVDHNHTSGEVRGLLCTRCNVAIGMARENPNILQNAIAYLSQDSYAL